MFVQTILIMLAASLAARPAEDTLTVISGINGADMTLYALYRDYAGNDRDKSMEYATVRYERNRDKLRNNSAGYMFLEISKGVRSKIQSIGR